MKLNSNNRYCFDFDNVINVLIQLSYSQGFYGRLLRDISEIKKYEPERFKLFVAEIESQEFTSPLDVVMYFEG
jgi:hypothetical protein